MQKISFPFGKKVTSLACAVALLVAIAAGGGLALAETQGSLGSTSQASSEVSLTIPKFIQINNVNDLSLGNFDGSNPLSANDDVCIFGNTVATADIDYTVTATSSAGSFLLDGNDGSNTDTVAFTATWNDQNGTSATLSHAITSGQFSSSHAGATCGGGANPNANIRVDVNLAAMANKSADTYNATLNLLIAPD